MIELASLPGYTLTRAIPESLLNPVASGAFGVFGGVIRNQKGQIMAHLINPATATGILTETVTGGPLGAINAISSAVNTYQLHRLGKQIGELRWTPEFGPEGKV